MEVDFQSMFARLTYLRAGLVPPAGDLYDLPGFEGFRDGVKRVFNAMLFRGSNEHGEAEVLISLPRGSSELLPKGTTARTIRPAILRKHPGLTPILERGLGLTLMHDESEILIAALERLMAANLIGLPIHDSLVVAQPDGERVAREMQLAALEVVRFELPVEIHSAATS